MEWVSSAIWKRFPTTRSILRGAHPPSWGGRKLQGNFSFSLKRTKRTTPCFTTHTVDGSDNYQTITNWDAIQNLSWTLIETVSPGNMGRTGRNRETHLKSKKQCCGCLFVSFRKGITERWGIGSTLKGPKSTHQSNSSVSRVLDPGHESYRHIILMQCHIIPSKIEWDLTNGPLSKLLELLDTHV